MYTPKMSQTRTAFVVLCALPLTAAATTSLQLQPSPQPQQIVDAHRILGGYVGYRSNTIGDVVNLVLTPDHRKVQYVLFDSAYPMSLYGVRNIYVPFRNVHMQPAGGDHALHVVVEHPAAARGPRELELSPGQAADRLVAGLIGKPLFFADGRSRLITDMLIDVAPARSWTTWSTETRLRSSTPSRASCRRTRSRSRTTVFRRP